MKRFLLATFLVVVLAALGTGVWLYTQTRQFLDTPPETPGRDVVVHIERGWRFEQTAQALADADVITDAEKFRLLARWKKLGGKVRAGEFRLSTGWTPERVLDELVSGRELLYRLQVREGLPWWETGRLVQEAGLGSFESFEAAIRDPELLAEFDIPAADTEGYLFPETYMLPKPKNGDARPAVRAMLEQFRTTAQAVFPDDMPAPDELHRLVILASIIEKETGAPEERERISGVYTNRLRRGMLLQADPTIIYGLGLAFDGNLRRPHLEDKKNPYNTYRHAGLPPGPIASSGREALAAAANPEQHKYLYFVSRKDGTHHFSKTLKEHNAAVRKYQLRRKK